MRSYRWFREDEVELLTVVGNQVGVAIENARLYQKERLVTQRLAVSERNYRGLFENANDAIWVHDLKGNITVANRASSKQTGYSLPELIGMDVRDMLPEGSLSLAAQVKRKLIENEHLDQPYEQRIVRKDGTEAILMLTTSLVVEDGVPAGFQNISRDVTEEKRMRENLDFYLGEVTKAQEEERTRIARELHDDTIQALVVLARQLDELATGTKGLSKERRASLEDLWQQANNAIHGVRRLSQDLRPPTLDRLGLRPTLEWLANDVSKYSDIRIRAKVVGEERRLSPEAELMLFRITQEALRNVWRHSEATEAELTVEFEEDRIRITVRDNGKGFDLPGSVGDLTRHGKLGLTGMQERARLVGGTLKTESEPGKGTTITVEAPI
jgi:PAS domain S-box-containing protein